MSILLFAGEWKLDASKRDKFQATPLHFAILRREFSNIELLLSLDADVNAQDFIGQSPLHLAVNQLGKNPDYYDEYKKIIKELCFKGADRTLKTREGLTPRELLENYEDDMDEDEYK